MAYMTGIADDTLHLMLMFDDFITGAGILTANPDGTHFLAGVANVGDGGIDPLRGTNGAVLQTITITFTSPTAFTTSGSVSGPGAAGTVGVLIITLGARWQINAGVTPFAIGDTFTIDTEANPLATAVPDQRWVRRTPLDGGTQGTRNQKVIYEGPGLAGTDAILIGLDTPDDGLSPPQEYVRVIGMATFNAANNFYEQVGYSAVNSPTMPTWVHKMPYWFVATGRSFHIVVRVAGRYYTQICGGFLDPIALPGDWPYPLYVGGSNYFGAEYNENVGAPGSPINPIANASGGSACNLRVRDWESTWHNVINWSSTALGHDDLASQWHTWPFWEENGNSAGNHGRSLWGGVMEGPQGEFAVMPVTVMRVEGPDQGILATIPHMRWGCGSSKMDGNDDILNEGLRDNYRFLQPEDEIVVGSVRHKVFPSGLARLFRSKTTEYLALE